MWHDISEEDALCNLITSCSAKVVTRVDKFLTQHPDIDLNYNDGRLFAIAIQNATILKLLVKHYEGQLSQLPRDSADYNILKYKFKSSLEGAVAEEDLSPEVSSILAKYLDLKYYNIEEAFSKGDMDYLANNQQWFLSFITSCNKFELAKKAAIKGYNEIVDLISDLMHDQYTKAAIYRHAALAIKEQDYNAAKKYLQQAIAIKKDYYPGYKLLGELYNEHEDTYRAADCFIKTDIHKKSEQYDEMYTKLKEIFDDNQHDLKYIKLAERYKDQVKSQELQIILKDISNNHTIKDEASVAESDHLTHEKSSESSDCIKDELPISSNVITLSATTLKQLDYDKSKDADDLRIIDYIQGVDDVGISSIGESSFQEASGHHTTA